MHLQVTGNYSKKLHHATNNLSNENNVFLRQMEGYDIVIAKEEDRERIADFLRQNFFKYEPINVCSGCPPNRPTSAILPLKFLPQGKSVLAVSRNGGHILGACLNSELKRNEQLFPKENTLTAPAYKKIITFIEEVEATADIWKESNADRAIVIYILGVHQAFLGRGIGRALMEATRDNAKSEGCQMISIFCTSYFSANIARAMAMKCVYTLPYSEYKDEAGNPVFDPPHPHTEAAVFVQELSSET
jgi:GNAT superfamily N-acetyltransferase